MRDLFNNKTNIVLFIVMNLCVVGIFLVIFVFDVDRRPVAEDFSKLREKEIERWMEKNNVENYEIKYEYSEEVSEGNVIYQSIKEGEKFDSIVITISKGKEVIEEDTFDIPVIHEETTRDELEKFFTDNGFTDVSYEYELSDLPKDVVIRTNVFGKVKKNDLILVTVSAGNDKDSVVVSVPDFTKFSLIEAQSWGKSNSINIKYETQLSETITRGKIISQSIEKGVELKSGDSITLIVSDGKGVKIPDFTGKTKEEITAWVNENKMENVKYLLVNSNTVQENYFIESKPKKDTEVSVDYQVLITISLGKKSVIETGQEGKTPEEFLSYVLSVNDSLKVVDSGYAFYSDTIPSGKVHSYDTGEVSEKGTIRYNLSLGPYNLTKEEYEGKNINDATTIKNNYNNKKAGIDLKLVPEDTTDSSKINVTYGCEVSGKTVTCKYGVKSIPVINAGEYNGLSETEARNKMTTYRNQYGQGNISISYGTYGSNVDKTYGCALNGNTKNEITCYLYREELKTENFTNITKEEAASKMKAYKQKYGVGVFLPMNIETDDYPEGKTFACTLNDPTISCNVAVAIKKASIMNPDAYATFMTTSYEGTKANLQQRFNQFTNIVFEPVESPKPVGQIVHIIVDGVTDSYSGGDYPLDTPIKIQICSVQKP